MLDRSSKSIRDRLTDNRGGEVPPPAYVDQTTLFKRADYEGEIRQMKSEILDLQTQVSDLKKDISVIHDKIDSNFFILEEMLKKMLEGQTKILALEVKEGTDS
ncbi:hypothetical protein M5K25_025514 [Dendrobium thyrsiflorum]|uniref:Uncharacterized protein n=1 Tax=Dendrobium thyrsiflorum TaxID=117978 RepID=A0ABD0U462_DENTH